MKGKMAIIGDGDSVMAFSAVGIDAFSVVGAEDAAATLKKLVKNYKIIFITDALAKDIDAQIKKYVSAAYPIIIPIPGKDGGNGYGMEGLKAAMDKALGVDVLFGGK